jgi:hypothetical protein
LKNTNLFIPEISVMSRPETVRTSRTYIHTKCGHATVVSGDSYSELSNPFQFTSGTMCVGCSKGVPLKDVVWEETGESIAAYRRRVSASAPLGLKLAGWLGPLITGLVGAAIGAVVKPGEVGAPVGGFVGGVMIYIWAIAPIVTKQFFKIDFRAID